MYYCLKKFSILFLIIAAMLMGVPIKASADSPAKNYIGSFYATVHVKSILDELEDTHLNVYIGDKLKTINEKYENTGKVYYKTEEGNWKTELPKFYEVGDHNVYYYVKANDNYIDLGSEENPVSVRVTVNVNKESWGEIVKIETADKQIINYLTKDGMTSAEVTGNDIIWLKEESYGTYTWYGLDNRSGIFAKGSKFWVKWLSKENDKEEWDKYYKILDESHKRQAEENKLWIFLTGVTMPDGKTEYGQLNKKVPFYIQLGNDWDEDDIQAVFIDTTADERIDDIKYIDPYQKSDSEIASIDFPETTGGYVKLMLKHFSPYAVYDKEDKKYENTENESNYIDITESYEQNEIEKTNKEIQNNTKDKEEKNENYICNYDEFSSSNEENEESSYVKVDNKDNSTIQQKETKEIESKKKSSSIKTGDKKQEIILLTLLTFSLLVFAIAKKIDLISDIS